MAVGVWMSVRCSFLLTKNRNRRGSPSMMIRQKSIQEYQDEFLQQHIEMQCAPQLSKLLVLVIVTASSCAHSNHYRHKHEQQHPPLSLVHVLDDVRSVAIAGRLKFFQLSKPRASGVCRRLTVLALAAEQGCTVSLIVAGIT